LLGAPSKATNEDFKEVQRRESLARKESRLLLDGFENNTDRTAERDRNFRASRMFKQKTFRGSISGALGESNSQMNQLDRIDLCVVEEKDDDEDHDEDHDVDGDEDCDEEEDDDNEEEVIDA
jgi:hypothetical protein